MLIRLVINGASIYSEFVLCDAEPVYRSIRTDYESHDDDDTEGISMQTKWQWI